MAAGRPLSANRSLPFIQMSGGNLSSQSRKHKPTGVAGRRLTLFLD